ncbi:hypothetical protein FLONG3_2870 [Fusarium longipes]|uniref:Uncharacterized protein n=1 Tax=Fusarium longipes TaxID=694270 RepID=A0A395T2J3_9HYPO|nr:hypothetical protein FLONG3_2870 [Fusarium longipes]
MASYGAWLKQSLNGQDASPISFDSWEALPPGGQEYREPAPPYDQESRELTNDDECDSDDDSSVTMRASSESPSIMNTTSTPAAVTVKQAQEGRAMAEQDLNDILKSLQTIYGESKISESATRNRIARSTRYIDFLWQSRSEAMARFQAVEDGNAEFTDNMHTYHLDQETTQYVYERYEERRISCQVEIRDWETKIAREEEYCTELEESIVRDLRANQLVIDRLKEAKDMANSRWLYWNSLKQLLEMDPECLTVDSLKNLLQNSGETDTDDDVPSSPSFDGFSD